MKQAINPMIGIISSLSRNSFTFNSDLLQSLSVETTSTENKIKE
jgi:hypothetical protein